MKEMGNGYTDAEVSMLGFESVSRRKWKLKRFACGGKQRRCWKSVASIQFVG